MYMIILSEVNGCIKSVDDYLTKSGRGGKIVTFKTLRGFLPFLQITGVLSVT